MFINYPQALEIPPYWLNHPVRAKRLESAEAMHAEDALRVPHLCSLTLCAPGTSNYWECPIDPVITISCKNKIVQRDVLKVHQKDKERRGSVKELWSQGDYEINISGVLISKDDNKLPEDDLKKLRALCEYRGALEVTSPLFTIFNITKICIEDYSFPFTKGVANQMYSIKAVSDDFDSSNLLIAK